MKTLLLVSLFLSASAFAQNYTIDCRRPTSSEMANSCAAKELINSRIIFDMMLQKTCTETFGTLSEGSNYQALLDRCMAEKLAEASAQLELDLAKDK